MMTRRPLPNLLTPFGWLVLAGIAFWAALGALVFLVLAIIAGSETVDTTPPTPSGDSAQLRSPLIWRFEGDDREIVIHDCSGGDIAQAQALFDWLERNRTRIRLTGNVASACTMLLSRPNVCWSARATFLFHRGWSPTGDHNAATLMYVRHVPSAILNALPTPWPEWSSQYDTTQTINGRRAARLLAKPTC